jgi:hypothetical protein
MSIIVRTQPKNRISINIQQQSNIKSVGLSGKQNLKENLRQLNDVDATSLNNNETIVYDEASDKFVVRELPIVNGGTF